MRTELVSSRPAFMVPNCARMLPATGLSWRTSLAARAYDIVVMGGGSVSQAMSAFRNMLGENDLLAYLVMMAPRLKEPHRVLIRGRSLLAPHTT